LKLFEVPVPVTEARVDDPCRTELVYVAFGLAEKVLVRVTFPVGDLYPVSRAVMLTATALPPSFPRTSFETSNNWAETPPGALSVIVILIPRYDAGGAVVETVGPVRELFVSQAR
jgi:hypothetical protein